MAGQELWGEGPGAGVQWGMYRKELCVSTGAFGGVIGCGLAFLVLRALGKLDEVRWRASARQVDGVVSWSLPLKA